MKKVFKNTDWHNIYDKEYAEFSRPFYILPIVDLSNSNHNLYQKTMVAK